jgi:hypothetical protein
LFGDNLKLADSVHDLFSFSEDALDLFHESAALAGQDDLLLPQLHWIYLCLNEI